MPTKTIKPFKTFFRKKKQKNRPLPPQQRGMLSLPLKNKKIQEKSLVSLFNNRAQLQYKFNSRSSCCYLSELVL
ncbi:hypothetical protein F1Z41_08560 [Clostridium perfringens]|nr:hypothetical protein [Clostridium perfringens]